MQRLEPLLVTATDTGVGKTWVAAALAAGLVERGLRVIATKPVESGCITECRVSHLDIVDEDGVVLAHATKQASPRAALTRLCAPLAAPLAAEEQDVSLSFDTWCASLGDLSRGADAMVVEGCGGFLSPLTWSHTSRELALALDAQLLVVAPNRLGSISHLRLLLEAARAARIHVFAIVYVADARPDRSSLSNADAVRRYSDAPVVEVPHVRGWRELLPHLEPLLTRLSKADTPTRRPSKPDSTALVDR